MTFSDTQFDEAKARAAQGSQRKNTHMLAKMARRVRTIQFSWALVKQ